MSLFMKASGVNGSASATGYSQWSAVHTARFAVQRDVPLFVGKTTQRYALPDFQHVALLKPADSSSSALFTAMCQGSVFDTVQIDMCHSANPAQAYLQYTLSQVIVTQMEEVNSVDGTLEKLLLHYTKINKRYILSNNQGVAQSPASVGYDLSTAKMA